MMKNKKPNKNVNQNDGSIPDPILNQVNEHTIGGFIIFYFNSETGKPEQAMTFDSPAHALAIQKHIEDWSETIHTVNIENSVDLVQYGLQQLQKQQEEDDDGDEEDGEEPNDKKK